MAWEIINRIAYNKALNIELEHFYKIIGGSIGVRNKNLSDNNDRWVYTAAYPDYIIDESGDVTQHPSNIICYSTSNREPAPIGDSKKQYRPIHAADYRNTETGKIWSLLLIRYIDQVRFDAFAPSSTQVEHLMIEFEKFMNLRMQLLEHIGLERIIYEGRGLTMTTMRSGYHNRSALYTLITEQHLWRESQSIDDMVLTYGIKTTREDTSEFEFPDGTYPE